MHLASLSHICHFWDQSTNRLRPSLVSSANIFAVHVTSSGRSLIKMNWPKYAALWYAAEDSAHADNLPEMKFSIQLRRPPFVPQVS